MLLNFQQSLVFFFNVEEILKAIAFFESGSLASSGQM
jgi:hypothetical protein